VDSWAVTRQQLGKLRAKMRRAAAEVERTGAVLDRSIRERAAIEGGTTSEEMFAGMVRLAAHQKLPVAEAGRLVVEAGWAKMNLLSRH
jgi:hypothetical protein